LIFWVYLIELKFPKWYYEEKKQKVMSMRIHRSIQADAAGRINLGKECAGALFTFSRKNDQIILEPAQIVSERELKIKQRENGRILLNEEEWIAFEKLMEVEEKPTKDLRKLMQGK
jgi:hypothetical protein